jgi:hypothetical protein
MAMKFDSIDRPERGILERLKNNDTPLKKVPFPTIVPEPMVNFQEVLATERYKDVVENYRRYTTLNFPLLDQLCIMPLQMIMMGAHEFIIRAEEPHRIALAELAIRLVKKELAIPEGAIIFDAKIVSQGRVDNEGFSRKDPEPSTEVDIDDDPILDESKTEDFEISKRRLINAIVQGASKRGHYMYHMAEDELKQITGSDSIIAEYGKLMSINDALYWQYPEQVMQQLGDGEEFVAGKEQVERNTTPPTVYAEAINFPILVHELIKGVMELFAVQGLPQTYEEFKDDEDTIQNEIWDLRLGPAIWKRLRAHFPEEILLEEDKIELQNYLLTEIFKLPAKEFLHFMRELFKESDEAKATIVRLMDIIKNPPTDDDDEFDEDEE